MSLAAARRVIALVIVASPIVSSIAQTDALAKLLIEKKGVITPAEFPEKNCALSHSPVKSVG